MAKRIDVSWAKLNTLTWVQKQDQYIQGVVNQVHPLIVNTAEGNLSDPKIYQRSEDNYTQMDDLIDLTYLNEPELLNALLHRYQQNQYQTFCGPVLVSLCSTAKSKQSLLQQMVNNLYNSMTEQSQSLIVTGELGSGKTEIEKLCQQYLAKHGNISQKLQAAQGLLEAFGNAKTSKNPNSSRFGKVLTLHYDKQQLQGAKITTVAFEKTRVNSGEQNFHIFYYFLSHNQLNQYYIDQKLQTSTLKSELKATLDFLDLFNINTDAILNIIASIVKLQSIQFDDHDIQCTITDQRSVIGISNMLGIHEKEFARCLCFKTRQTAKNEIIDTPLSRIECINQQQNIIKYLYEKLFQYLVEQINYSLCPKLQTNYQINLVDMQGFEWSSTNNFEHLIINYIHEKLQHLYINQIFLSEMQLFQSEGLQYQHINAPYSNNQFIVDSLDKPPLGILNILDDSCAVAGTDETFLTKLKNIYLNHQVVTFSKQNQPNFKIKHSPKEVEYNVIGFRIKNKDENNKQFQIILSKSKNATISTIYTHGLSNKYIGAVLKSQMNDIINILRETENHFIRCIRVSENDQIQTSYILNQIRQMGILECLKVRREGYAVRLTYQQFYKLVWNQTKKKNEYKQATQTLLEKNFAFTDDQVLFGQKRIFIKQQAFKVIRSQIIKQNELQEKASRKIQNAWICYKNTMIFRDFQCRVKYIQAHVKGFLQRQKYIRQLQSIVFIQFQIRKFLEKQKHKKLLNCATVIQTYFKRLQAIKYIIVEEQSVIKIQQFVRSKLLNQEREMEKYFNKIFTKTFDRAWKVILFRAATKIQKTWKGFVTRKTNDDHVQSIKLAGFLIQADRAATIIQKYVKRNQTRNYYLQMRQAAIYIQGWIRSRWLRNLFHRIRFAAIMIQRGVRKYFNQYKQKRKYQSQVLKPLENELNRIKEQEFMNLHDNFIEQLLDSEQENVPGKKIDLFSQVIDLEILTDVSEIYDTLWTSLYKRCFKECYEKQNNLSTISLGECHTYVGSLQNKIYSWGINDQLQQGLLKQNINKINQIQFSFKIKTIKSGANHGLILNQDNILYSTDDKVPLLKDVKLFSVYNDDNVAVDENNLIYIWKKKHKKPQELKSWTTFIRMSQLQQKISVHQISHGLQFMVVLSTNGLMFSMGENTVGELGVSQGNSRAELTLIELQDKIAEVHCGMKHTIAKSTLGKVYTWGWGQMGQLGQGNQRDESFPKLVQLESKALQVMAGHKQSIVLLETRKMFWWGTNSCLAYQSKPIEYMINYPAVRVICSWSRTLSLVYVTFAKTYKSMDANVKLKHKIINSLISKWSENDVFSIDPPYCESLANYFTQMKKPQVKTNIKFASKIEHQQLVKQLQQSPFNLLDDLKETNGFFSFKNESNMMLQKQIQEHSENTNILQISNTIVDNSNKQTFYVKQIKIIEVSKKVSP